MNNYSHLVLANEMVAYLQPTDLESYFLGAIIPDVRYYAKLPRKQTHIKLDRILAFVTKYPHLRDFILGYWVHCCIDRVDPPKMLLQRPPFNLIKGQLPKAFPTVLAEYYYMQTNEVVFQLSEQANEMLDDLGVAADDVREFAFQLNKFLANPSFDTGIQTIQNLGLVGSGVERYLTVAHYLNKHRFVRQVLFTGVGMSTFTERAVGLIQERLGS